VVRRSFSCLGGKQLVSRQVTLSKTLSTRQPVIFVLVLAQVGFRTSAMVTSLNMNAKYLSYGIVLLMAGECVREKLIERFSLALIVFGAL